MNVEEKVKSVFAFQLFTQALDPFVIEQFKILPLVFFPNAQSCEIVLSENLIEVFLIPKKRTDGLKFDFTNGKNNSIYNKKLIEAFDFWFKGLRIKPTVKVQWKQDEQR